MGVFWYIFGFFVHFGGGGTFSGGFLINFGGFFGTFREVCWYILGFFLVHFRGFYGTIRGVLWYNSWGFKYTSGGFQYISSGYATHMGFEPRSWDLSGVYVQSGLPFLCACLEQ